MITEEEFLEGSDGGQDMTREQMIEDILWHDNVGQADNVDFNQLSDDELRKLRAEVIVYFINRQEAWSSLGKRSDKTDQE